MPVCKFFQQGWCKYGNSCRFDHPANNASRSMNRFGAPVGAGGSGGGVQDLLTKYHIVPDVIQKDMTAEAPQWILSAYAPSRDVPEQLFGGYLREQSFEELRLHHWMGKASGNEEGALNEAQQLWQNAKEQMDNAAQNPQEAAQYMAEGENRHPNRHDICRELTQGAPFGEFAVGKHLPAPAMGSGFPFDSNPAPTNMGMAANTTSSSFGQPSTLGQHVSPFAQSGSAFGQPSQPQPQNASPFGGVPSQPQAQSAFGQPSQMGSSFGQASTLGAKPSPFAAPAFGQASQPGGQANPFGQPPAQAQGSAFGQTSQMGQTPNPFAPTAAASGPFAQPGPGNSAPAANPFSSSGGQTSSTPNPFASGANQGNAAAASPFGQAQQQQQQQAPQNAFAQPSQPVNVFASSNQGPTPAANNPFAQQQQQQPPSIGGFANASSNANPFAQQQQQQQQQQQPNGAQPAAPPTTSPYPANSSRQHPPITSYTTRDMTGRLISFKDKPVTYKDGQPGIRSFDGTWSKIWFPNGPPGFNKDTEIPLERYDDGTKAMWMQFAQAGNFMNGAMPELPPPRECTQWDF